MRGPCLVNTPTTGGSGSGTDLEGGRPRPLVIRPVVLPYLKEMLFDSSISEEETSISYGFLVILSWHQIHIDYVQYNTNKTHLSHQTQNAPGNSSNEYQPAADHPWQ